MKSNPTLSPLGPELAALVPRLRRFGRLLTGHPQDADDLVQHALERAWLHRARWEPGTRLDSWVLRIMHNAWIDEVRSRQRRAQVLTPSEELEQIADQAVGASPVDAIAVRQALARLRDEHRAVVVLVLVDGLSYKEAAHVLDIPMGTLTSRLARGREHLQALLSSEEKRSCPT